jgi:hypothetical protein
LGNNYESLQVTIAACNSGGFAHKDFVEPRLQGTWSVTAARDVERGMSVEADTKEERQKDYTENRKVKGLKIGQLDGVDLYWYSYPPAYAKTILDNGEYSSDHRPSMQMGPGSVLPALAFFLRPTQPTLAILSHRAGQQQGHPWPQG